MNRLSTMILACALSATGHAQPLPPTLLAGSVLGTTPSRLEVVLLAKGSVTGAWAATVVDLGGSRRGYSAEISGEELAGAAAGTELALGFRSDGKLCSKPLALESSRLPSRVDVLDGEPKAATHRFTTAYVEIDEARQQLDLTAVISRLGTGTAQGTLQWSAAGVDTSSLRRSLEARADGVAVSRITTAIPAGTTLPQIWEGLWLPADAREPEAFYRSETRGGIRVLADGVSQGLAAGGATLFSGALTGAAGEHLAVDLELPAGASLTDRWLADSKTPADASSPKFSLDRCRVTPLAGGKLWASGRWLLPRDISFSGLTVSGGAVPAGWIVRRIFVFVSPDAESAY